MFPGELERDDESAFGLWADWPPSDGPRPWRAREETAAERRKAQVRLAAVRAAARRYGNVEGRRFERGWDAALDLATEIVRSATDRREAYWLLRLLAAGTFSAGRRHT